MSSRVESGADSIDIKAPPALCAKTVRTDEIRLTAIKGIFSIHAAQNVFRDWILSNGYQSKISRTKGRVTAMGLLSNARTKNTKAMKYCLLKNRSDDFS